MPRVTVAAAEAIIGEPIKCLDQGHVMLVDYMGGDESVTQAARTSYAKDLMPWDPVGDPRLINYLMAHRHSTPFEMVQIKVRMKLPMFVARQWVRHRTASLNEVSARYSKLPGEFYLPELSAIQGQSADNKQGRSDGAFSLDEQLRFQGDFGGEQAAAYLDYNEKIDAGMARRAWPASTSRCPPTPSGIGTRTCGTCCTCWACGWTRTRSWRSGPTRTPCTRSRQGRGPGVPGRLGGEHVYLGARFSRTELAFLRDLAAIHKFQLGNQAPAEPGSAQTVDPLDPEPPEAVPGGTRFQGVPGQDRAGGLTWRSPPWSYTTQPCADGFTAAWVAHRHLAKANRTPELFRGVYGFPPADVAGREVYLLDFTYPRAVVEEMAKTAKHITILDHHETAWKEWGRWPPRARAKAG